MSGHADRTATLIYPSLCGSALNTKWLGNFWQESDYAVCMSVLYAKSMNCHQSPTLAAFTCHSLKGILAAPSCFFANGIRVYPCGTTLRICVVWSCIEQRSKQHIAKAQRIMSTKPFMPIFLLPVFFSVGVRCFREQKKKEEEKEREKELNDLFKVAISQPKVPVGTVLLVLHSNVQYPYSAVMCGAVEGPLSMWQPSQACKRMREWYSKKRSLCSSTIEAGTAPTACT